MIHFLYTPYVSHYIRFIEKYPLTQYSSNFKYCFSKSGHFKYTYIYGPFFPRIKNTGRPHMFPPCLGNCGGSFFDTCHILLALKLIIMNLSFQSFDKNLGSL